MEALTRISSDTLGSPIGDTDYDAIADSMVAAVVSFENESVSPNTTTGRAPRLIRLRDGAWISFETISRITTESDYWVTVVSLDGYTHRIHMPGGGAQDYIDKLSETINSVQTQDRQPPI